MGGTAFVDAAIAVQPGRIAGMLDQLSSIFEMFQSQFINIPMNNGLSILYVVLNAIMLIFTSFFGV